MPMEFPRKCTNCQKEVWTKSTMMTALVALEKGTISKYKVQSNKFLPVRAYVCNNCGKVELYTGDE